MHGSIAHNLSAAIESVRRLRGHPVYPDTLRFWERLLNHARQSSAEAQPEIGQLVRKLEMQLADRRRHAQPS